MGNRGERDFYVLLQGYLDETLSPADLETFLELAGKQENIQLLQQSFEKDLEKDPVDLTSPDQAGNAWSKLNAQLETGHNKIRRGAFPLRWVAAAACLIAILGAAYFLIIRSRPSEIAKSKTGTTLPVWLKPDHVGATLYLMNGDSVSLDYQSKGLIATQGDSQISQSDGSISYSGTGDQNQFNEIKTGPGKLFRCLLPDQTVVWLNGRSSVKFPLRFSDSQRSVDITGEVYFEVTHHAALPFRVKSGEQILEDVGTKFNIDAAAENSIITTLVEGSVIVQFKDQKGTLIPGEQTTASQDKNLFSIDRHANLDKALAWKNGFFYFQNAGLHHVMDQLSDWYHVNVQYQGPESKAVFNGQIDKSLTIEQVLKGLQQPGVSFSLNNDQLTVIQK